MKIFVFFILILAPFCAHSIDGIPNKKYLLNSYYNPNRLVFRLNKHSFECSMLGVSVPYFSATNPCNSEKFRNMSHLTIGYMQNNLYLEQQYSLRVENGYCIVAYNNVVLNEKIIADGYAVVNPKGAKDAFFLEKLKIMQTRAMQNRVGLWNSFADEMKCFSEAQ